MYKINFRNLMKLNSTRITVNKIIFFLQLFKHKIIRHLTRKYYIKNDLRLVFFKVFFFKRILTSVSESSFIFKI